jgi:hypothetical protein
LNGKVKGAFTELRFFPHDPLNGGLNSRRKMKRPVRRKRLSGQTAKTTVAFCRF